MTWLTRHVTACFVAGIVAILPVGGTILTIAFLEWSIGDAGVRRLPFYFPGLGLLIALAIIYVIGLTVTTFIGKWLWKRADTVLNNVPALGRLYATLKQILGYGEGEDAVFYETVLVPAAGGAGEELGLITNRVTLPGGQVNLVVFIPGSPNPATGRLIITRPDKVRTIDMPVSDTLKTLVSVGKTDLELGGGADRESEVGNRNSVSDQELTANE